MERTTKILLIMHTVTISIVSLVIGTDLKNINTYADVIFFIFYVFLVLFSIKNIVDLVQQEIKIQIVNYELDIMKKRFLMHCKEKERLRNEREREENSRKNFN